MHQWRCHWSLLLTPLTLISTVGESYAVIYSKTSSNNYWQLSISWNMRHSSDKNRNSWLKKYADRICWQNVNLLTRKICWQNVNLLTKTNLLTREICWQNLLTKIESADDQKTVPARRIKTSSKSLHHASQTMAGAHIPSVKINACLCAWAGPSSRMSLLKEIHSYFRYTFHQWTNVVQKTNSHGVSNVNTSEM